MGARTTGHKVSTQRMFSWKWKIIHQLVNCYSTKLNPTTTMQHKTQITTIKIKEQQKQKIKTKEFWYRFFLASIRSSDIALISNTNINRYRHMRTLNWHIMGNGDVQWRAISLASSHHWKHSAETCASLAAKLWCRLQTTSSVVQTSKVKLTGSPISKYSINSLYGMTIFFNNNTNNFLY